MYMYTHKKLDSVTPTDKVFVSVAMEEGSSSSPSPLSDSSPTPAGGTSNYLLNLPSRGFFSSTVLSSNPGGMRVYMCDHDTSPPEDQQIKTNQQNILIRSLLIKKQKGESTSKDVKSRGSKKRAAEKALDGRSKRAVPEGSSSHAPAKDFQSLTVEKLRALLREKGLSIRGKKDELVARLRSLNS